MPSVAVAEQKGGWILTGGLSPLDRALHAVVIGTERTLCDKPGFVGYDRKRDGLRQLCGSCLGARSC